MATMNELLTIGIPILGVLLLIALGYLLWQRRKDGRLKKQFGPEYDRVVERADDRSSALDELRSRKERVSQLELRELNSDEKERFSRRWIEIQRQFVDQPVPAVEQADRMIVEIMELRGYPVEHYRRRAADLSVHFPKAVQEYRQAHQIAERNRSERVPTEELRQAFVHYRTLFEKLVGVDVRISDAPYDSHSDHDDHSEEERAVS